MLSLESQIEAALKAAVEVALGAEFIGVDPQLRPAQNARFGDYQANLAMSLGKQLKRNPRELAGQIAGTLERDRADLFSTVEVAGPGFINLRVHNNILAEVGVAMLRDPELGLPKASSPDVVVIDYSSPNVAKEMHVGHLRSTVIGDALARILEALGHQVIRQNHLGDWGTQFGMLIENMLDQPGAQQDLGDLTPIYQAAKHRFDHEPEFQARARQRVVALQSGDAETLALWQKLVDSTVSYLDQMYERLGVKLRADNIAGESFYNPRLPGVIERLRAEGQLRESDGAQVVFLEGFENKQGEPLPMIVQKSDGGYLYATTDLAAALYRTGELQATRIIIVVGLPQRQHFEMLFQLLRSFRWVSPEVRLEHVAFGSVLGPDRKMLKTRSGESIKLVQLLDEAEERARAVVQGKNPELGEAEVQRIANAIGIGALKYADLSSDRIKDYIFDWERMLAFDGNTAPYLVNAYVRIQSIFRKANQSAGADLAATQAFLSAEGGGQLLRIEEEAERALALQLVRFGAAVHSVAESLEPHRLCGYLYELASAFHTFYEHCPVLKSDVDEATRQSRLVLCALSARVLNTGLGLLGIQTVEQM